MKKLASALLALLIAFSAVPGLAGEKKDHVNDLKEILFGNVSFIFKSDKASKAFEALQNASYLAIDQFNGQGKAELLVLKEYGVPGLPRKINKKINFSSNFEHRKYTHLGWDYDKYEKTQNRWERRKKILLDTTQKVFGFGPFSGKHLFLQFPYDEKCDSFAALVYYIHILGDYKTDKNSKYPTPNIVSFATITPSENNTDIFFELTKHLSILFSDQQDKEIYKFLMRELNIQGENARNFDSKISNMNSTEKKDRQEEIQKEYEKYVSQLKHLLIDNIPKLLREEEFFKKVFD